MVIILHAQARRREEREKERKKENESKFSCWPQLCFFSVDDVCVCVCWDGMLYPLIDHTQAYIDDEDCVVTRKEWEAQLYCLFFSPFSLARSRSSSRRMDIFEQLQGHFDVNNDERTERGKGRERERERTEREKVIRTSKEPLHIHIDRAYYSDWVCSLGIIVSIRTYVGGIYRSNRCSNYHLRGREREKK